MKIFVSILFMWFWLVLTVPISFSIIAFILKPILSKDPTGTSLIALAIVIGVSSGFIGMRILNRKVKPWLFRNKT